MLLRRRNDKEFEIEKAQKATQTRRLQAILTEKKETFGMKIDGLISEEDYQKEKKRLLSEEKLLKETVSVDGLASWTRTMEEMLAFAANVTKIFNKDDPVVKRMTLRILGSNLRKTRYQALIWCFLQTTPIWSGIGESNPFLYLGKVALGRLTNPANRYILYHSSLG